MAVKVKKIKINGLWVYPVTILEAIKSATKNKPNYGKTLSDIIGQPAYSEGENAVAATGLYKLINDGDAAGVAAIAAAIGNLGTSATVKAYVDALANGAVATNTQAIATLNGASTVEGSVAHTVATEIAKIVNENNNGSIDTLNEIAAWIINDTTGAAKMAADIQANKTAIGVASKAETTPGAGDAVVATGINKRLEDLETAVGEGGSVDSQIDAKINALDKTVSHEAGTDGIAVTVVQEDGKLKSVSASIAENTYDSHGSAATAKSEVIGTSADAKTADTVNGAKAFATDAVDTLSNGAVKDNTDAIALINKTDDLTKDSASIAGAKLYADDVASTAASNVAVTAAGDNYITAAQDASDKKKINVSATVTAPSADGIGLTSAQGVYGFALTAEASGDNTDYDDLWTNG